MSMRTWQKAVIFTAVASSSISTALASEPINPKIDPCDSGHAVTLVGVLAAHHEYGPPGWGEDPAHDTHWTLVVLKVSRTTAKRIGSLLPGCFVVTTNFNEVQLWSEQGPRALSKYQGKEVRVVGSLWAGGTAPAERRDAQVRISNISLVH